MAEKLIIAMTAEEAVSAKNPSSAFLAGGTEIERLGSLVEADTLILMKHVPGLSTVEDAGDSLRIGALCTFQKALEDSSVPDYFREALSFMASRTKRNMATVGGNISLCRCDSYLMPTLMAAGASLELLDKDGMKSTIPVSGFCKARKDYDGSLILAVLLPKDSGRVLSRRYANTAQSHAVLTVSMSARDGVFTAAAGIKHTGLFLLKDLFLKTADGSPMTEEDFRNYAGDFRADIPDDIFGSPAYKRYLLGETLFMLYSKLQGGDAE